MKTMKRKFYLKQKIHSLYLKFKKSFQKDFTDARLTKRQYRQNKHFIWTKKRIEHFRHMNEFLSKMMEEVYDDVEKLNNHMIEDEKTGTAVMKNYMIEGYISCFDYREYKYGTRAERLCSAQEFFLNDKNWCVWIERKEGSEPVQFEKDNQLNKHFYKWEIEEKLESFGIPVCYYLFSLLEVSDSYSLKDLLNFNEDNFAKKLEVRFYD